jgi:hypothetical protein
MNEQTNSFQKEGSIMTEGKGCTTIGYRRVCLDERQRREGYYYRWRANGWARDEDELVRMIESLPSVEFDVYFCRYDSFESRRAIVMTGALV